MIDYPLVILIVAILAFILGWKYLSRNDSEDKVILLFKEQAEWMNGRINVIENNHNIYMRSVRHLIEHVTGTPLMPGDKNPVTGAPITGIENPDNDDTYLSEMEMMSDPDTAARYMSERWRDD